MLADVGGVGFEVLMELRPQMSRKGVDVDVNVRDIRLFMLERRVHNQARVSGVPAQRHGNQGRDCPFLDTVPAR